MCGIVPAAVVAVGGAVSSEEYRCVRHMEPLKTCWG